MTISVSGPTGITVETDPLALKLTGGGISGDLTVTQKVGIGGVVPVGANNKLAVHNGNIVFTAGYGIAFGDGTSLTTAPVAPNLSGYALLSGAAFTGNVTANSNTISARRFVGVPNGGVAGVNIGTGGTDTASTTAGDLWIASGGVNLNFRDGNGSWRICATTTNGNVFSAVQTIDVNSASTALRVTQRGTGAALVVEDTNNPDSSPTIIDAEGNVGIGVQSAGGHKLYVNGTAYVSGILNVLGLDVRTLVTNHIFSGANVKNVNMPIETNISYKDGNGNTLNTGDTDYNGNVIQGVTLGIMPNTTTWSDSNPTGFVLTPTNIPSWYPANTVIGSFVDTTATGVTVYSDGAGGVTYNPPPSP